MAKERDYAKEYEREKERRKLTETAIIARVLPSVAAAFKSKCVENGTTQNAVLQQFILEYTYGERAAEIPASIRQQKRKSQDNGLNR